MTTLVRLALALAIINLVLIQPNHPRAMTWGALRLFPLELPFILAALIALPERLSLWPRRILTAILMVIAILKIADYASFVAYNRAFNPVVDFGLVRSAWEFGSGTLGVPLAAGAVALALAVLGLMTWALSWAMAEWARVEPGGILRGGAAVVAVLAAWVVVAEVRRWPLPLDPPGAAFTAHVGHDRALGYTRTLRDLREFRVAAATDPFLAAPPDLALLQGRDILLIYVESYGRASMDNPLYAPTHIPTLRSLEDRLPEGAAIRSGWLTAPMVGGQSWLAHSSVAAGLWISDQTRYRTFLASGRRTLYHKAAEAGWFTTAIMPAITRDWPEGDVMGFDLILPAAELGYEGLPFNWVTMPDQFTMVAFDRLVRNVVEGPVFAQIALISSHAPWVPVPEMLPWDAIGDGTEFNEIAQSDDPPDVVWRDRDRVREQYRRAVDYALQVVVGYVERQDDEMPLFIVLGDHQSANFVAQSDSFDVPIHVIGPADVLDAIEPWGWTPGMIPDPELEPWTMDLFRDAFLSAFSSPGPAE
ncbi:MAG: sulfatase [Rubellimicrobium sp.]|nr:sulfatase [Rubellimicrobium sp.]